MYPDAQPGLYLLQFVLNFGIKQIKDIISLVLPCSILKSWDSARKELVRVANNYFHHLVLRIEAKPNDSHDLFFENQDILQKHLVSASLCQLYERKFQVQLNVVPKQLVETRLIFTHYAQPELL